MLKYIHFALFLSYNEVPRTLCRVFAFIYNQYLQQPVLLYRIELLELMTLYQKIGSLSLELTFG